MTFPPMRPILVTEQEHRRKINALRVWVVVLSVGLGVVIVIGGVLAAVLLFRATFAPMWTSIVASSPRDCRVSTDAGSPRLFVAIDVTTLHSADLTHASTLGPLGLRIEGYGFVASLAPLASLDDAELTGIVHRAAEHTWIDTRSTGVVVAIIDIDGEPSGHLDGLRTQWVTGEPLYNQDLPLGVEYDVDACTVTTAG